MSERIERKINEIFKDEETGKTLWTCEGIGRADCDCVSCVFGPMCGGPHQCSSGSRTDCGNVFFKEVKAPLAGMLYRMENKLFKLVHKNHRAVSCLCEHTCGDCVAVSGLLFGYSPSCAWAWEYVGPVEESSKPITSVKDEEPKRHISIQKLHMTETEVTFRITKQTHRYSQFCENGSTFRASNGVSLFSQGHPHYYGEEKKIFLCGSDLSADGEQITVPTGVFSCIKEAVGEYNATDGKGYVACGMTPPAKNTIKKFWMVYLSGGDCPKYRHANLESAKTEAERLSRKFHKESFVLECVQSCTQEEAPITWKEAK